MKKVTQLLTSVFLQTGGRWVIEYMQIIEFCFNSFNSKLRIEEFPIVRISTI